MPHRQWKALAFQKITGISARMAPGAHSTPGNNENRREISANKRCPGYKAFGRKISGFSHTSRQNAHKPFNGKHLRFKKSREFPRGRLRAPSPLPGTTKIAEKSRRTRDALDTRPLGEKSRVSAQNLRNALTGNILRVPSTGTRRPHASALATKCLGLLSARRYFRIIDAARRCAFLYNHSPREERGNA
jgi:hypothetical protein